MDRIKNKKFKKILLLVLLLLSVTIGYAALTSNLTINGTSTINNPSWDVHWDNVQITNGSVTGTKVTTAAHILTGNTEVEYSITLGIPGEYYEFTVDAVNAGSIDAMIGSFSNKVYSSNGTTERSLPDYLEYTVTYNDETPLANNHLLAAESTQIYKVRVSYKTDIDPDDLPSSADTLVFKFNVTYVQADDDNVILGPQPTYLYAVTSPSLFLMGGGIPVGATIYSTYQSAITAYGHNIFLRHGIKNNQIRESYVGFVYDSNVYFLRGGGVYNSQTNSYNNDISIYNANKTTLVNALGSNNCTVDSSCGDGCFETSCADWDLDYYIAIKSNGYISVSDGFNGCYIDTDFSSYCDS